MTEPAERAARAALSAVTEPGAVAIARRVLSGGPVAAWRAIRSGGAPDLDPRGTLARRAVGVDGAALLDAAAAVGQRFICPGDAEWPEALDPMTASMDGPDPVPPPLGLWVRGAEPLPVAVARSVAVVGSRAASRYGAVVASDLGSDLALLGWTVVSGAAYGVDAAAHRGALALDGGTVAVLACGADVAYPRAHADLLERIADAGLVISELPPGSTPTRSRFLARNRLIAGLAAGVVVVEAALRSGARSTAGWAQKLSREVLVIPGPVTSALSAGCHELIRQGGATLVTDAREVVEAVGVLGADALAPRRGESRPLDGVSPDASVVFDALSPWEARPEADVLDATKLPVDAVRVALAELCESELVVSDDAGGWRILRGGA
ncbi:MAG TPA: DNA-processing protein DprA [Jiangellaceae bacterium]